MTLPEVRDFGEPMDMRVGVICTKYQLDKGFIPVEECMRCPGKAGIRCYPRQFLLSFLRKQTSDYYGPKWGIYHVSDVNMCSANFLYSRMLGKFFTTNSLWNMRFGTELHGWFNQGEISRPIVEQPVEHVFEDGGRKLTIVGSQDAVFRNLDLDMFTDVREWIESDKLYSHVFAPHIKENRFLQGIVCDRKSTISMKSIESGPKDYHVNQLVKYVILRDEKDISGIMITYLDKKFGKVINGIIPVIYEGSPMFESAGQDIISRSLVINKTKIIKMCEDKASNFENFLKIGYMPMRVPSFKKECDWCAYKPVCKHEPPMPVTDRSVLEMRIEKWEKMLRISPKFEEDYYSVQNTIDRWTEEVFEGEGQGDTKVT